jgi:predicted nucleic acid-binding protein
LSVVGIDTSVAVPLLVATHPLHAQVVGWCDQRELALCGHALAETYSVLTRLPGDMRVSPAAAAQLIDAWFAEPLQIDPEAGHDLVGVLSRADISGGAVYDALVALAAVANAVPLATRDARATETYNRLGAEVVVVG